MLIVPAYFDTISYVSNRCSNTDQNEQSISYSCLLSAIAQNPTTVEVPFYSGKVLGCVMTQVNLLAPGYLRQNDFSDALTN